MSSIPSTVLQARTVSDSAPGVGPMERLPDCVDSTWLLQRMLSRSATALILFTENVCVYASAGAGAALGIRSDSLEHHSLDSFLLQPTARQLSANGCRHWPRSRLKTSSGHDFDAECWIETLPGKRPALRSLMFRPLSPPQAEDLERDRAHSHYELANVLLMTLDPEGRIVHINPRGLSLLACTEAEAVGSNWFDEFLPHDIRERVRSGFTEVMNGQREPSEYEQNCVINRRGEKSLIAWSCRTQKDERGEIAFLLCSGLDITHQRKAERDLRTTERRFHDYAAASSDYFWETDAQGRFIYLSERFQQVRGLEPERVLGKTRREAFGEALEEAENGEYASALRERKPFTARLSRRRPDGSIVQLESTGKPVFDQEGRFRGYRGSTRDITDAHVLSEELTYQATHDALTGLLNRRAFEDRLNHVLEMARNEGSEHVMCYLDLDQFKVINDTCGHDAGDELLRQLCVQLKARVRKRDTLARLGGDEFGVLMEHCTMDQADRVADALRQTITDFRFPWNAREFRIGASIGMAAINGSSESVAAVMSAADAACYVAKDQGRNRVHVSRENDVELSRRYTEMECWTRAKFPRRSFVSKSPRPWLSPISRRQILSSRESSPAVRNSPSTTSAADFLPSPISRRSRWIT